MTMQHLHWLFDVSSVGGEGVGSSCFGCDCVAGRDFPTSVGSLGGTVNERFNSDTDGFLRVCGTSVKSTDALVFTG